MDARFSGRFHFRPSLGHCNHSPQQLGAQQPPRVFSVPDNAAMPHTSQDHVHRLIQSMSPAEKRYFKVHLARNGQEPGSNQQVLFDAIAGMPCFDERALHDRFQGAPFMRHFAITKRRLYEAILHSLEAFHAESSTDARLHRLLHQVELLHRRALYADAWKVLQSARKMAEAMERLPGLQQVADWERRLHECRNCAGLDDAGLDAMRERSALLREAQAQIDALWDVKSRLFLLLYRQGSARGAAALAAVQGLLHHPLLHDGAELLTSQARFLHHHVRSAAAFAAGEAQESRRHLLANLELLERERHRFKEEPNLILGVMSNLAYVTVQCGLHDEAFELLRRFRALPAQWGMPETEDLDVKLFATTTSLELSMHLRVGQVERAMELMPMLERGLRQHGPRLGPVRRAALQYLSAYAHLAAGDPEGALKRANEALNASRHDDTSDTACFTRLLHLLILADLGKHDLLPYAARNTERYLRIHRLAHRFEPRLLQLVRSLARAKSAQERTRALTDFRDDALALLEDPMERRVLDHLDPIAWAESRISGKPLALTLKERAARLRRAA